VDQGELTAVKKLLNRRGICLLLLLAAGIALVSPPVRWRIIGCIKNESFYQGRPTSYWRARITTWREQFARYARTGIPPSEDLSDDASLALLQKYLLCPNDRQALVPPLSLDDAHMTIGGAFLSDPAGLAVLIELVRDPNREVGLYALERIVALDAQDGQAAIPVLVEVLKGPDVEQGRCAAQGLYRFGAVRPEAVGALIDALEADDDWTCTYAALALGEIGPSAKEAVPGMVRLLERKRSAGPPVTRHVPNALMRIDPAAMDRMESREER
jgi:hypothetical protein